MSDKINFFLRIRRDLNFIVTEQVSVQCRNNSFPEYESEALKLEGKTIFFRHFGDANS